MHLIFVGGVHGVGKSTCCATVAERLGLLHVKASDLIRRQHQDAIASGTKRVTDVDGNQGLLIKGVNELRRAGGADLMLLDGHFALVDGNGDVQQLAVDVFRGLLVWRFICFVDEPQVIASRRKARDGRVPDPVEVATLQSAELGNARAIANELCVPLTVLDGLDVGALERVVATSR